MTGTRPSLIAAVNLSAHWHANLVAYSIPELVDSINLQPGGWVHSTQAIDVCSHHGSDRSKPRERFERS